MKRQIAFAIAAVLSAVAPALAQTEFPPAISVTGEGTVSVPPDLAQIDAGVTTDGKTAREAADANTAAMTKVIQALKGTGIADKDYQSSRLSLQPQYGMRNTVSSVPVGPGQIIGYRASNRVTIKLHDVARVASMIDTLVTAGANDIGGINFVVSNASKLLDEAREQAVADARRKAEIYAKAAGVTLGAPLSISEEGASAPVFRTKALAVAPMSSGPPPVAQGEETLSISVSMIWAIKQGP